MIERMKSNRFFPKADGVGVLPKHDRTAWLKGGTAVCEMPPRKPLGKAWRMVLLGAPGIGKGTQAELLCERLGTCHLSTGDVFRTAKCLTEQEQTRSMKEALKFMRQGALVPDETVLGLIRDRLRCLSCSGGFMLDGFPRTVAQAEALEKILDEEKVELTAVLNYELPIERSRRPHLRPPHLQPVARPFITSSPCRPKSPMSATVAAAVFSNARTTGPNPSRCG